MQLLKLLSEVSGPTIVGRAKSVNNLEIRSLAYDSRSVRPGALFFAISGLETDGNIYIPEAIERGAVAIASEKPADPQLPVEWLQVESVRRLMAECSHFYFEEPSKQIRLAGVTGTNGKTTTAYLLHSILQERSRAFMMGSIKTAIGDEEKESVLTTPEAIDIQSSLQQAVHAGCRYGVMEVSSHALFFDRVYRCHFPVTIFTNLSQDHLDFHKNFEEYFLAKSRLFDRQYNPGLEQCVLNGDDPYTSRIVERTDGAITRFGMSSENDVFPEDYDSSLSGLRIELNFCGDDLILESPLIGRHNLYNIMAAASAASRLGISPSEISAGVRKLQAVPGRFERLELQTPYTVVIDFAHTPDALSNVLHLANEVTSNRTICVFGCGGDRDRSKRPQMGEIAVSQADIAIVTSDNPRTEDPDQIIREIEQGIPVDRNNYESLTDRKAAIRRALEIAEPGDLVLIAGKGHETYQSVAGKKIEFDERKIVREVLCSL